MLSRHYKRPADVLTGHCSNNHLHTMGLITSPNCNKCGEIESAKHFLCHCTDYIFVRAKYIGGYSDELQFLLNYLNITST